MKTDWGVDKRQVTRFWISHSQVRILAPQPYLFLSAFFCYWGRLGR